MGNQSKEQLSEVPLAEIIYFPEENITIKDIKRGMILLTTSMSGTTSYTETLLFVADDVEKTIDFLESEYVFEGYIPGCKLIKFQDLPKSKQDFLLGKTTEEQLKDQSSETDQE